MAGLAAYLACTVAIAALACGHQGQDWPLPGAWRWLRAHLPRRGALWGHGAPHGPSCDSRVAGTSERPSGARVRPRPSWSHSQPLDYEEAA